MYKFGLKLWSTNDFYLGEAIRLYKNGSYNYIELYAVPGSYSKYLSVWSDLKIPFIIHAPHFKDGVNLAKKESFSQNIELAKEAFKWADALSSKTIIFHPGISGEETETIRQINVIKDERVVVENKPFYTVSGDLICNGNSPERIKQIIQGTNVGFCLDIGHTICSANAQKLDPIGMIKGFIQLGPKLFHLSDGDYNGVIDQHKNIGLGSYDIGALLDLIPLGSSITIETDKRSKIDLLDFEEDIQKINEISIKKISFRAASIRDSVTLLEWRNDPLTRKNSINVGIVELEAHNKWFLNSLNDHNRKIFIAEINSTPIGTVRFDKEATSSDWELSWTIAPCMRGKGLGKLMVKAATRVINSNLKAKVRRDNTSSSKIAIYAGFKNIGSVDDLLIFKLEK